MVIHQLLFTDRPIEAGYEQKPKLLSDQMIRGSIV